MIRKSKNDIFAMVEMAYRIVKSKYTSKNKGECFQTLEKELNMINNYCDVKSDTLHKNYYLAYANSTENEVVDINPITWATLEEFVTQNALPTNGAINSATKIARNTLPVLTESNKAVLKNIDDTFPQFLADLNSLGLIGTTNKIGGTDVDPQKALSICKKNLKFMGLCGEKWMNDSSEYPTQEKDFEFFLRRIKRQSGKVKFLLIHPNCEEFETMKRDREGQFSPVNYPKLLHLATEYKDTFEVRLYKYKPSLRMLVIDSELLAISNYVYTKQGYFASEKGFHLPHLLFGLRVCFGI